MPLIGADQTFVLGAFIMAVVAFGFWAETRRWGQKLGGPLLLLAVSMAAANANVIPHAARLYDTVAGLLVPMAIPLLLMRADFRTIWSESGPMFGAFLVAVAATVLGAAAGTLLVELGPLEPQIVGTITSSYIGGSLNFVATSEAVGIRDSSIYVAALSADAVGAVFYLVLLMLLPAVGFVRRWLPSQFIERALPAQASAAFPAEPAPAAQAGAAAHLERGAGSKDAKPLPIPFNLLQVANGLAVSLTVCAASALLTSWLGVGWLFMLMVTALSLAVANFAQPVVRRVSSEFEIGALFMYVFFVTIGAGANLEEVLGAALPILLFIAVMVLVHIAVIILAGRFLRLDLAEVMIASNACILGPPTAAALAASKGWRELVAPGILVGLLGYALGTFIGVTLTALLQHGP